MTCKGILDAFMSHNSNFFDNNSEALQVYLQDEV